jgi:hypothetical protein
MIDRMSKRKEIRMVGIKHIKRPPAIATSEFSAEELA